MLIKVTNIQRGCVHDGSGIRTTIFLKGCHLKCPWCCNPETKSEKNFFSDWSKCLFRKGVDSKICENCSLKNGNRSLKDCPFGVYTPTFREYTPIQLLKIIKKDFPIFKTNGGVTFSGGEPLLQTESLLPLLKTLKEDNINIAIETTLFVNPIIIETIKSFIDEWIVDLKLQPQMYLNSFDYFEKIFMNLNLLSQSKVKIRLVVVKNLIAYRNKVIEILKKLNIKNIELLKCHNLAEKKYIKLGENNQNYTVSDDEFKDFTSYVINNGFEVNTFSI